MRLLRQTFLWFCSTLFVLSGVLGQGFVLCMPTQGNLRLETSTEVGRCHQEGISHDDDAHSASEISFRAANHCDGCQDVSISDESVQIPTRDSSSLLASPTLLLSTIPQFEQLLVPESIPQPLVTNRLFEVLNVRDAAIRDVVVLLI